MFESESLNFRLAGVDADGKKDLVKTLFGYC